MALNTWHPLTPFTYVQGDIRTQIDFILTRELSASRQAKHATPLQNFPLGSWKKGGHLTPVRHWHLLGPQIKPLQHNSAALQDAVRTGSQQAQQMLAWVQEHLEVTSSPQEWDELLIGATERLFPKAAVAPMAGPTRRHCPASNRASGRTTKDLAGTAQTSCQTSSQRQNSPLPS